MQFFEANGVATAYRTSGRGAPIVLLHGGEADHTMFDGLSRALNGHFAVIAYDQRDSGATRNPSSPYSLADLADDAAALIRGLGPDRAHVMRNVARRPDRAGAGGAASRLHRPADPEQHMEDQQEPAGGESGRVPHAGFLPR